MSLHPSTLFQAVLLFNLCVILKSRHELLSDYGDLCGSGSARSTANATATYLVSLSPVTGMLFESFNASFDLIPKVAGLFDQVIQECMALVVLAHSAERLILELRDFSNVLIELGDECLDVRNLGRSVFGEFCDLA